MTCQQTKTKIQFKRILKCQYWRKKILYIYGTYFCIRKQIVKSFLGRNTVRDLVTNYSNVSNLAKFRNWCWILKNYERSLLNIYHYLLEHVTQHFQDASCVQNFKSNEWFLKWINLLYMPNWNPVLVNVFCLDSWNKNTIKMSKYMKFKWLREVKSKWILRKCS